MDSKSDSWMVWYCDGCDGITSIIKSNVAAPHRVMCPNCFGRLVNPFEVRRVDLDGPGQARITDPPTAKAAAKLGAPRRGTQRYKVLEAIRAAGLRGATSHELEALTDIRYASLTPRIGELKHAGLIRASGATRLGRYGVEQEVLVGVKALTEEEIDREHQLDEIQSELDWGDSDYEDDR